jgi:hypothetical protein
VYDYEFTQVIVLMGASFVQVKKMIQNIRQYQVPLQKYMAMMDLQVAF